MVKKPSKTFFSETTEQAANFVCSKKICVNYFYEESIWNFKPLAKFKGRMHGRTDGQRETNWDHPRENFDLWVSLEAFFMHFDVPLARISVVLAEIFGQNNIYIYEEIT